MERGVLRGSEYPHGPKGERYENENEDDDVGCGIRRGGVCFVSSGTFTKTGGSVIYGNEDAAGDNKNTSTDAQGHAVYVEIGNGGYKKRDSTAGTSVSLDSDSNDNWE